MHDLFSKPLCSLFFIISFMTVGSVASAQVNASGTWVGSSIAQGSSYPNTFSLVQNGNIITGSATAGAAAGVITGTITGSEIIFHSEYKSIHYSSDAFGTTDGLTMSGSFIDSQGTSGTFSATKSDPVLTPKLPIANPPIVQAKNRNVTFTFTRFSGVQARSLSGSRAGNSATTIEYELTVKKGSQRQKVISKRNRVTLQKLSPGTYKASYTASAVKQGKKVFSSKTSPAAVFTIK